MDRFYVGLSDPKRIRPSVRRFCLSVARLEHNDWPYVRRRLQAAEWILDSGGYSAITLRGRHPLPVRDYAYRIRWMTNSGALMWAAAQDWPCTREALETTGLCPAEHFERSMDAFLRLRARYCGAAVVPVVHGLYAPDYERQAYAYAQRFERTTLRHVGVGGLKRFGRVAVRAALLATRRGLMRASDELGMPSNWMLHGFGLGKAMLNDRLIRRLVYSADSMAWSLRAWYDGRDHHAIRHAETYRHDIEAAYTPSSCTAS